VHTVDLVIVHGHVAHSTATVHIVVIVHLTALVVVFDDAAVSLSKLVPLHIGVVQAVIIMVLLRMVTTVAAIVARARSNTCTVDVSPILVDSELDFALVTRLANARFCTNSWEGYLILHLVEDEKRHSPLSIVLVPDSPLPKLVLI